MRIHRLILFGLISSFIPSSIMAADTPNAPTEPRATLVLDYDLYWKGFKVMNGLMTFTREPDDTYKSALRFETKGVLDWFDDGLIRVVSTTSVVGDHAIPTRYEVFTKWDKERYVRSLTYPTPGTPPEVRVHMPDAFLDREDVPEDAQSAMDPVSLILLALKDPWNLAERPDGTITLNSYDGLRAFQHVATCDPETERFKTSRKVPYEGDVLVCRLTGQQTHGFMNREEDRAKTASDRAKTEDRKQTIELYLAWAAEFSMYVPVRIEAKSDGGRVVAYLKETNSALLPRP